MALDYFGYYFATLHNRLAHRHASNSVVVSLRTCCHPFVMFHKNFVDLTQPAKIETNYGQVPWWGSAGTLTADVSIWLISGSENTCIVSSCSSYNFNFLKIIIVYCFKFQERWPRRRLTVRSIMDFQLCLGLRQFVFWSKHLYVDVRPVLTLTSVSDSSTARWNWWHRRRARWVGPPDRLGPDRTLLQHRWNGPEPHFQWQTRHSSPVCLIEMNCCCERVI